MRKSTRIVVTFPTYLKRKVEEIAQENSCSQAEVLRMAFIRLMEVEK